MCWYKNLSTINDRYRGYSTASYDKYPRYLNRGFKSKQMLKNSYLATVMKPYKIGYLETPGFWCDFASREHLRSRLVGGGGGGGGGFASYRACSYIK